MKRCRSQRQSSRTTNVTQREVNREATTARRAAPMSDSGQVTIIVLGDCWVVEVPHNGFRTESLEIRIKLL